MNIAIAGPYSNADPLKRQKNLDAMNAAAAVVLELGHTPLIGVNAALPVLQHLQHDTQLNQYEAIMQISMAVISCCDALLLLAESPGALRERDAILAKGGVIYYSVDELPAAEQSLPT